MKKKKKIHKSSMNLWNGSFNNIYFKNIHLDPANLLSKFSKTYLTQNIFSQRFTET